MNPKISATEFQRNFGAAMDRATQDTLIITNHGRERIALVPFAEYRRLKRIEESLAGSDDLPEEIHEAMRGISADQKRKR